MANITPGFDFGINEVPTHGKFIRAASGLSIDQLVFDEFDDATIKLLNAPESGGSGSSPPAEGHMWFTPRGEWMVATRWNQDNAYGMGGETTHTLVLTPLNRGQRGGWATTRIPWGRANRNAGIPVVPQLSIAEASSWTRSFISHHANFSLYNTEGGNDLGVAEASAAATLSRIPVVARGVVMIRSAASLGTQSQAFKVSVSTPTSWELSQWSVASGEKRHTAEAYAESGQDPSHLLAWLHGKPLYGSGAN